MNIESKELIDELAQMTRNHLNVAQELLHLDIEELNSKSDPKSWSILECLEHLNRYGHFYIPEIEKQINQTSHQPAAYFRSYLLGDYVAKSMLPREKLNKMKTFKSMNPLGSQLDQSSIQEFIDQQQHLLSLLEQSRKVNLHKTKTRISISNWIKLKLGDTLRVVIYHNYRHLVQIERIRQEHAAVKYNPKQERFQK